MRLKMETTLVHQCVVQLVDALFRTVYSDNDTSSKPAASSSICTCDDESLAAMRIVLQSFQTMQVPIHPCSCIITMNVCRVLKKHCHCD